MNLREYLIETKQTQEQFADKVGLARKTINTYLNQPVIPRPMHCMLISKVTSGKVTEKDFSQEHILKIKTLVERYGIKIKELAYVLGFHNKFGF